MAKDETEPQQDPANQGGDDTTPPTGAEQDLRNGTPPETPPGVVEAQPVPDDGESPFVYMKHPGIEAVAGPIRREAVVDLWSHKGWEICDQPAESSA